MFIVVLLSNRMKVKKTHKLNQFSLKTINFRFRSRIGIKVKNYRKIIKMNRHGDVSIYLRSLKFEMY